MADWPGLAVDRLLEADAAGGAHRRAALDHRSLRRARQDAPRARSRSVATPDGRIAELFTGGKANHNLPLGWAQSLYIVAKLSLRKLLSEVR